MPPISIKAGIFRYAEGVRLDEFELRVIEKARLFACRILVLLLFSVDAFACYQGANR